MNAYAPPRLSLRFVPVWRRNFLVWRKLPMPSMLGNLADPMIYMLGLGYGLGSLLPEVGGVPYIAFLAAGTGVLLHHEQRHLRGAVLGFFAHARAAHLGRHHERADGARRCGAGRTGVGGEQGFLSGAAILAVIAALGLSARRWRCGLLPVVF
jgi:lipooligosaccharide transport system permease protein